VAAAIRFPVPLVRVGAVAAQSKSLVRIAQKR